MMLFLATVFCLAVDPQADKIVAHDLAKQFPALAAAPSGAFVSFAPAPGAARTFSVTELARVAARLGITATPENEICVERGTSVLREADLLAAMRQTLPEAAISIADFSRIPAPEGRIEFRLTDLRSGPGDESYWRGIVHYAGNRQFPIWAKVKATVTAARVKAIGDLPAGKPIEAGLVSEDVASVFPSTRGFAKSAEQVVGRIPRLAIHAGAEIRLDELDVPKDVLRGDPVKVVVTSGAAHLEFDAVAEGSGAVGARIEVHNPDSNKSFLARVEGKGRVSVDAPATKGNQ